MQPQERFAGLTPGMMMVLGADVHIEQVNDQIKEIDLGELIGLMLGVRRDIRHQEGSRQARAWFQKWLKENEIQLKEQLGRGHWGQVWRIDSGQFGNDIALKVTSHMSEVDCVEWIEKNQVSQPGGHFKHLPEIYESGEIQFPDELEGVVNPGQELAFYYMRPMYEMTGIGERSGRQDSDLIFQILAETDGEFYGWDVKEANIGVDDTGEEIYFDPACYIGPNKKEIRWLWNDIGTEEEKMAKLDELGISVETLEKILATNI